jgi:formylglycine-generating enzyme required for sulfatase activity
MSFFGSMGRRLDRLPWGWALLVGVLLGVGTILVVRQLDWPGGALVVGAALFFVILLGFSAEPLAVEVETAVEERVEEEDPNHPPRDAEPGQEWTNPVDGSVLVFVPEGWYTLGSEDGDDDEKPVHQVFLSGFWIGRDPVTHAQYRQFLESGAEVEPPKYWDDSKFNSDQQPVVGVSWHDAMAYCEWAGLKLPTEAQWEAAARGEDQRRYPWGDEEPTEDHANFENPLGGSTSNVGQYPKGRGPFGTFDQAGNVWEWCLDPWDEQAYAEREGTTNPTATGDEAVRVVRGGSWDNPAGFLRSAIRLWFGVLARDGILGFRCVGSVPSEP